MVFTPEWPTGTVSAQALYDIVILTILAYFAVYYACK